MRIKLEKSDKFMEFSKRVIVAMTILWFIGAGFGGYICLSQGYGLESLLTYIGGPMGAGIIGYMCKSAFENREKIIGSRQSSEGSEHP